MARLLRGRYEPLSVAGRGGQGDVLRAADHQHNRTVALKMRRLRDAGERESLLAEARVLLALAPNPHLPVVRDDFFVRDRYYLVMDWIDGRDLAAVLADRGALPLGEALPVLRQVASALDHLHAHRPQVLHLDVKPGNVIQAQDGRAVLVDLGLSGSQMDRDDDYAMGSQVFRAPEVLSGARLTPAADVYSLAATALTLLSGAPPRPGARPELAGAPDVLRVRVWRALEAGLSFDPAKRPASASALVAALAPPRAPTNLPADVTHFVGRSRDTAELAAMVRRARLATVAGPGGIGKTRLALRVAADVLDDFPDGVWVAELAPVVDPALVPDAVAVPLGVAERQGSDLETAVAARIGDGRVLLVLDNCEHLVEAAAALAERLLGACPNLRVLATSREELGVYGESVWQLRPLEVPEAEDAPAERVLRTDAAVLFAERARLVKPEFRPEDEPAAVARICRRLDGMPLAIELAAARLSTMTAAQIAERLDDRFELLVGPRRARLPRHQTLRSAVDWSYDLLSTGEQDAFARLAVFAAGFTSAAARVVTGAPAELLRELVAKSLVMESLTAGGPRNGMLETIRAYALEKLTDAGREDEVRAAHAAWALSLVEEATGHLQGPEQADWLDRLEAEHDNLRAALLHSTLTAAPLARQLAGRMAGFWRLRGHWTEGRRWLEGLTRDADAHDPDVARAMWASAGLAHHLGEYEAAERLLETCLAAYRATGDRTGEAHTLVSLGEVREAQGRYDDARAHHEAARAVWSDVGSEVGTASSLSAIGAVAEAQGRYADAQVLHEQALEIQRELGDRYGTATSLVNLGYVAQYQGHIDRAQQLLSEGLEIYADLGDRRGVARVELILAVTRWIKGDLPGSMDLTISSLRTRVELGDRYGIALSMEAMGGLAAFHGHGERSATMFGFAEVLREQLGAPVAPSEMLLYASATNLARQLAGDEAYAAAWARGRSLVLHDAVTEALDPPERRTTA